MMSSKESSIQTQSLHLKKIGDLTLTEIEEAKAKGVWTIATWMQPKEERQRLYDERAKQIEDTKAELLKSQA